MALRADEMTEPAAVVVGAMRRRHLRSVLRIEQMVYPRPWSMGLFMSELSLRDARRYLVARRHGSVVGYAGLMLTDEEAHVTTIAVDPAHHRQGIATRLLLVQAANALEAGSTALTLEVRVSNLAAQDLYRRFGFSPAGVRRSYYPDNREDALVMWAHDIDSPEFRGRLALIEAGLPTPTVIDPTAKGRST